MARTAMVFIAWLALGCGSQSSGPSGSGAPGSGPPASGPPAPITEPGDSCTTSDDCELVEACCGCNAGGKKMAIRKDAVAGFEASRAQRCSEVMCAQVISNDPSCDAEAVCGSRNRCRIAPHMQHQPK